MRFITEQESIVNGIAVAESWNVTVADIGVEKLHYRVPAGVNAENIVLYVKDASGNWAQRDFSVEGSYMIFSFTHGESGIALQVLPEKSLPLIPIAGGAAALMLIVIVLCKKSKAIQIVCRPSFLLIFKYLFCLFAVHATVC